MSIDDEVVLLQRSPIFAGVEKSRLTLMALNADRAVFAAGRTILERGASSDWVYVVLKGKVRTDNPDITISGLIGIVGSLLRKQHEVNIYAETDVQTLRIPNETFIEIVENCPQTAMAVMRELARRLNDAVQHMAAGAEVT